MKNDAIKPPLCLYKFYSLFLQSPSASYSTQGYRSSSSWKTSVYVLCAWCHHNMRESINYNMIPLPCDNMNILVNVGSRNFLTNISSNAYYGYQSQVHVENKETSVTDSGSQGVKDNVSMDVQDGFHENNCDMQIENDMRHNRKRRCCYDGLVEFKKRRQNPQYIPSNNSGRYKLIKVYKV